MNYCMFVFLSILCFSETLSFHTLSSSFMIKPKSVIYSMDSYSIKNTQRTPNIFIRYATVEPSRTGVVPSETMNNKPSVPSSFVNDVMRPYAMKLHTRDQAPREGKQAPQTPFTAWEPTRQGYLQFLQDSLTVYEALEDIVHKYPKLSGLRNTGLERTTELREDIEWMLSHDSSLTRVSCGPYGQKYAVLLYKTAEESLPRFVCHYYNQYFAHTAGGIMIGKRMSDKLLGGVTLKFYTWKVPDVKVLLESTRNAIDEIAITWNEEEKDACLKETMVCFEYSGSLFTYVKPPKAH